MKSRALLSSPVAPALNRDGRSSRAYQWVEMLGSAHDEVCLVYPADEPLPAVSMVTPYSFHSRSVSRLTFWWRALILPLLSSHPTNYMFPYLPRDISGDIDQLEGYFDTIIIFRMYIYPLWIYLQGTLSAAQVILDLDDHESRHHASLVGLARKHGRMLMWMKYICHARIFKKFERNILPHMDGIVISSDAYQSAIQSLVPDIPVTVMTNAQRPQPILNQRSCGSRLLFIGTLGYLPNRDALNFLLTQVMPLLRARSIDFHLTIAGRGVSTKIRRRHESAEISFVGYVADLSDLYAHHDIAIIPLSYGSGTKIKVIEALNYGLPVITTMVGNAGIHGVHGESLWLAETAAQFADAVYILSTDPSEYETISRGGRQLFEQSFAME